MALPGGNGNYFRIRNLKDAEEYMKDVRRTKGYGVPQGDPLAWLVLAVVLIVIAALALLGIMVM